MMSLKDRWLNTTKALFALSEAGVIETQDLEECLKLVEQYIENKYGKL